MAEILSFGTYKNNAEVIVACRDLGYLDDESSVWDSTYGEGNFWNLWRPKCLFATDLDENKGRHNHQAFLYGGHDQGGVDFTDTGFSDRIFYNVVFDPPYKLNGTEQIYIENDIYGVRESARWQDRMDLIRRGVVECARVLGDGYLLVKCQDQVCSGKIRWQTDEVTKWAAECGLGKVDRLDMVSYRPQPKGRSQKHSRRNTSSMLIFKRGWK